MTMMFEAEDLEQASPATVSRVGMIFCEIRNLDWQPLRDVWLLSLPVTFEEHRPLIVGLFDWLFPAALYFVQKQCVIPTPVTGQVGWISVRTSSMPSVVQRSFDPGRMAYHFGGGVYLGSLELQKCHRPVCQLALVACRCSGM